MIPAGVTQIMDQGAVLAEDGEAIRIVFHFRNAEGEALGTIIVDDATALAFGLDVVQQVYRCRAIQEGVRGQITLKAQRIEE